MPAVLVLLAAVADKEPEPPVVLAAVFVPEGVDVCAAIVLDVTDPVIRVTSLRLCPPGIDALIPPPEA